ncbi:MAG: VCBS domain-containing protein, partial [Pseudomonadaceae bacterium]|nr:VCBS domain-containing protein [Pseudomonadaceae bacterium]
MNTLATVVTLTGRAWAVTADGQRRKLKEGDRLRGDEMLVTEPGARVDLDFDNNQMLTFLGEQQQNIGEAIEFAQAELPPSAPRPAAEGRQQPQAQPAQADGEPEGHNFVQLVRINEIIEADGITPLTIARIQEVLRPLGMSLPERVYDLDEWREHRGGDERYEDAPAARHPGLTVELQGAGPDGIYSEAEIGTDGTVPAEVTLDDKVRVGDRLVIKDGKGNILLDRPVTQNDLDNGVTVEVPVVPGDRNVTVEATVTTPRGYTGQDRDDKPVDNLPPDEVTILPPQDSEDAESINLDLGSYFEDNVDGKDLTYDVTGLPPGLSFDPDTGIITGTIDRSASQGGPDDDGIYKVTVTITDKVGNQTTIDFDWTVTNPEPEARDDRQTIDEDTVATGNVLTGAGNDPGVDGSDSDPDGDDLTVTSFTIGNDPTVYPADGTPVSVEDADGNLIGEITLNENGDYSFTPVPDWNGSVPDIHYTISDGEGGEDEARLSITVAPVNDPVELENIPDPNDPNDPGYPAVNDPTDPNDPARGNANDHVVFESALPGGSDQSSNQADLKVESSFTINAPDGLHGSQGLVLTYTNINGESRTLNLGKKQIEQLGSNNQTVDTQYGKLVLNGHTLNADGTISIDYEYTLERAPEVGGDHVDDRINIAVRDSDAHHPSDTDSKDLVIRIIDDAPVARNDANGIDEDTAVPVTGNVIANGSTGDVADTQGADGATVTGVTAGDQTAGGHVADGGVAGNIIGDYGTLVLNADGSYSYELDNSNLAVQGLHPDDAPLTDVFTYTITDADGDQSTATLTITVNGSNDGVTVTVPDPNDPADPNYPTINDPADPNDPARGNVNDHVVFESGLAGGSATNADDTRVVSSFTLSALDGLDDTAAITIEVAGNRLTLSKAEVEDLLNNNQSITTEYGELLLNDYTPNADGSITIDYEYTLTSAPDNTGGNGDSTDERISITVNDRDTDSDSQDLVIRIIDDAPVARDDTNQVDEDVLSVDGNVITSSVAGEEDTVGADGATVTGVTTGDQTAGGHVADGNVGTVISGQYGDLTLDADGSYSYQLDNSNLVVQGLTDGDTLTETFTYTITDQDGDQATATLTITINGTNDGVTVDVPVNDGATTPDGNVNDHVVFESGLTNGSAPNADDLTVESSFTLVALDGLATSSAVELTFTNTNGNTQTLSLSKEQVEQLDSDPVTLITQYGELVLNGYDRAADGTITIEYEYTLQRAPEVDAVDVRDAIGIKVTDRDGDQDDSQSINIKIVDDAPVARDDTNQITEDAVAVDGNVITSNVAGEEDTLGADGATVTGVTAGDQTAGGHVADGGVAGNIIGDYGTLVLNADGSYSYELDNSNLAVQGLHPDDAPLTDVFTYTITDADGDQSTATLTITVNGSNDGVTVTVPDPNDPADPNYPTINDPTDPNDPARGNVNDHVVFESGLAGGSAANADDTRVVSSFTLSALDGLDDTAAITIEVAGNSLTLSKAEVEDLANSSQSISTEYGELVLNDYTLNADGSITIDYEYTLTSAPDNTGGNGDSTDERISITVNDRDTDSDSQDLVIRIIDDAPVARDDANEIAEDAVSVGGNVIANGSAGDVADTEGADGATVTAIVSDNDATSTATTNADGDLVIEGEFGTLTISPDGSYTYALNNDNAEVNALKTGETLVDEFSYTLTDIDGDSDTATLTITINGNTDGAPTIVPEDVNGPDVPTDITSQGHVTVHERGLTGADSTHINDGSVTITAPDGLQSITVGGVPVDLAQLAALDPNDPATHIEIDTPQGKLTLTGFDVTDSVGGVPTEGELQFTYELEEVQNTPANPADPDVGRNSTETIPLIVTDAGGGTGTGDLVINIIDDVPVAVDDTNVITEDQLAVTGNVIGGPSAAAGDEADTQGADGATVTEISSTAPGSNMTTLPNGDLVIEGQYGTLTIRPDGFYTYELNNEHPEVNALKDGDDLQDVFTYTLTDGDGDSDTADLTITINGRTDGAPSIVPEDVNGNGAIDGHNTVSESGLVGGSTAGDGSNIVDGTIQISAGDGLASITISGQTFDMADLQALSASTPSAAIPVEGGTLVLTGFTPGTSVGGVPTSGILEYTYTLTGERTHSGSEDQSLLLDIPLSVTDAGNGTANGTLTIQVVDDAPQASDDTNSITEDDLSVVGNVIDGDAAGDGADIEGADSATITDISSTSGNSADDSDPSGVLVIEGEYGTLTIQPNGEYEYVLNNDNAEVNKLKDGETLTEEFTYTLTDTDGDSDTARLTITINGRTDASPSIVPEDDNGNGAIDGHNTVNESGLRDPADADTSNIVDGSIQISAGDGLASISIGGQTFSLADLQALSASTPSAAIPVEGGTLVLTGFTPGTSVGGVPTSGTLEYTYTLTSERAHSGSEDQSLLLDIPLSVTDAGNETANGTLTIQVMDDVPTAVADIGNVTEGATLIVDAANGVLTNDTAGADGWHALGAVVGVVAGDTGTTSSGGVGGRIDGQYGYLILNADGSYEYVSTADAVTGDEVDVFTYTVRDGDGDLSHTTLTINVADVTLTPVTTPDSVNESGLVGGSTEGDNSHITSGQVNLPPELEVIPDSGTTTYGTFTIDEDGNYTYTLTGTTSGDATTDSFTYVTTDANGNTVTNTVTIDIVDDEPVAVDDANSITEDEVSVTGNVIGGPSASTDDAADTEGADGATVTEISSAYGSMIAQPNGDLVIEGQYGKLTIRPDGFYTYELNNDHPDVNALKDGVDLQDVFTYTLTDGDGDSDTADLTITINGRTDGAPDLNITDHNGLDVGHNSIAEDATAPVTGEFTVTAPDGLEEITIGGITVTEAELADLTGNPVTIPGTEGTLTLTGYDPDTGKVTYEYQQTGNNKDHSGGDNSVTDHFPITVTDKGGDTSAPSDLVILITDTAPVANPDTGSIDEDGAALIGNVITDAGSGEDEIGADLTTVTGVTSNNDPAETATDIGGGVLEINGEYGTLTIQPDGSYTYELHDSAKVNALKDGDVRQEVFEYTITDSDGDSDNTTLTITINGKTDGSPSIMPEDDNGNGAIDGHNTVNESGLAGGSSAGDGSNIVDGTIQLSAGDGLASISIAGQSVDLDALLNLGGTPVVIPVEGGTLELTGFIPGTTVEGVPTSGELQYSYTLTGERTHSGAGNDDVLLDIPLSVTDAGNETVNGTLTIQVVDDVPEADTDTGNVTEGGTLTVDAANGVLNNDDSGADGWASTGAVVGVVAGDTNATSSGGVGGRIDGQYGYLILNADGSYEYVSTADAVTGDEVDVFTYTVRDGDGDLAHTTLTINVADVTLAPETTVDSVNESGLSGGTTEGDNSHTTSGQVNLPPGLEVVPGSGTTTHGTFTIDQDGNYSYTLTGNTSGDNTSDSFTYVTRDANGNTVENTVTINIVDDRPVAVDDVNSIPAGSYVEVTGELINGGLGGAGQDSVGADGATVTSVVNTPVGEPAGTPVTVPTDGTSTTITGQYGVLTIEADGSYSYQRNPGTPGGVEDVFTYTITDGDGDTDEATLTIDIGNATPSIRDLTPSVNGGELVFEEKHLAVGSAPDSAQLTKSGDFTISSPDGIGSLVVGTVTVIENGVLTSTTTVITPQGHTLEITGYDPVTGRVTYEYTLTGREDHDQSTNDTELFDEIPVVLTDRDGEVANDTLSVRIIDDVPQAAPDTGSIAEDTVDPLEGNVRTNDERGADGATVTEVANEAGTSVAVPTDGSATTINGQYGVLTIEADGSYSYELDNDNAEVNALKDGETLTEEFTYTLTDGDGDSDNTTLTITINGRTDGSPSIVPNDDNGNGAIDGHNTVNESGLAGG